jgi:cytochrome c oxidase cbb3-type subunit 2
MVAVLVAVISLAAPGSAALAGSRDTPVPDAPVVQAVRNDLGEIKWVAAASPPPTPAQVAGRQVFESSGCPYCHSRAAGPDLPAASGGPGVVSAVGGQAAKRGFGPNLAQVGLKYGDDWHRAHYWNPRWVVPNSAMPRFTHFFDGPYGPVDIVADENGNLTVAKTPETERLFDFSSEEQVLITPNEAGFAFVRAPGRYPVIHTPNGEYDGEQVTLVAGTERLDNLIAYVQSLGLEHGKWRDVTAAQRLEFAERKLPASPELIEEGRAVYEGNCIGCHGPKGNGNGLASTFFEVRPRNFTYGLFKFRVTPTGSLPTDGDLMRTLTRGVRGTAMPSFHDRLSFRERLAVIQYVKSELAVDRQDPDWPYAYFAEEQPGEGFSLWLSPVPSSDVVAAGAAVWEQAKCWECHGREGRGDGEKAAGLEDDFGYPIRPANLTRGLFKSGVRVKDIYRTITTGLNGTPMPSYANSLPDGDRWALAYYVASLSAFKDTLTGRVLALAPADRAALNDPDLDTYGPHGAYVPFTELCSERQRSKQPLPWVCGQYLGERSSAQLR